jgi:DNA/RNA-binding domain of Phe-tRNA-synthetase-like protein
VDAVNLASVASLVPIAAFDIGKVAGDKMTLRFSNEGEEFWGIGTEGPRRLEGGELIIADGDGLVAIYPHRDAERTKLILSTTDALLIMCGAPGVPFSALKRAAELSAQYMESFCRGRLAR